MIGKAMIEIRRSSRTCPPSIPASGAVVLSQRRVGGRGCVKYYGEWMREKAWERIGHLYPQVDLPRSMVAAKER